MTRQVSDVEINILEVVLHNIGDWIWKLETFLVDAYAQCCNGFTLKTSEQMFGHWTVNR